MSFLLFAGTALFSVLIFVPAYIFGNLICAAWLFRVRPRLIRVSTVFFLTQLKALSLARIWGTVLLQFCAIVAMWTILSRPPGIGWFLAAVSCYVFVVSALVLSLLSKIGYLKSLWEDAFFRVAAITAPLFIIYAAKGYGGVWINDLFGVSATNLPMTHVAATCFLIFLVVGFFFAVAAFVFEILFILALIPNSRLLRHSSAKKFTRLILSSKPFSKAENGYVQRSSKYVGIILLTLINFISCFSGIHIASLMLLERTGGAALKAIAFEFDMVRADICNLTSDEKKAASGENPLGKVLFLSTSQEKAILTTRDSELFSPIWYKRPHSNPENNRNIEMGRVVECYSLK